ncbi:hypothetical protein BCR36DRAFT_587055 [Piromyces finnis]|uniref:Phospholipase/carboxylesterase/thioesterase domain-containing protein n=1 Tax=Piromyces finnis TaxID=1754191 RepID=A0A1Y1UY57_9FUNG|nr:hypothetical protein BCR36DRAFT_587055 [Piromyces finnis]|eukprot:ORX42695.1 hypothetical protein BCR36DRAFT_587055 [Piromyces finnis]
MNGFQIKTYSLDYHGTIYSYLPPSFNTTNKKYPLVMALCCTTGNPQGEVISNGWDRIVEEEDIIVVSPTYNNYATYSETKYIKSVIDDAIQRYPIDTERIYSTGFSNGGALSVAMVSTYPTLLAGISAMGWMISMNKNNHFDDKIPFLLIQGTKEYTQKTESGDMAIMDDEIAALDDLFTYNNMKEKDIKPDYKRVPFWGYEPDKKEIKYIDHKDYEWDGKFIKNKTNVKWEINYFYADNFKRPFAELILVNESKHTPHDCNARFAWNFFSGFKRTKEGKLIEE